MMQELMQLLPKPFDEFPDETDWDVVIIGGGPNGLMAGAYLAKAGVKVAVAERRYEVGGGLATLVDSGRRASQKESLIAGAWN